MGVILMTLDELIEAALKAKQTLGGEARVTVFSEDPEDEIYVDAIEILPFINELQIII